LKEPSGLLSVFTSRFVARERTLTVAP
jgi:hypothetical protein